jgi:hypothetical protein
MEKTRLNKTKRLRSNRLIILGVVTAVVSTVAISLATLVPIDSFSAGCPSQTIRLSILDGGGQKIEDVRQQAAVNKARYPFSMGCSPEPLYKLYII